MDQGDQPRLMSRNESEITNSCWVACNNLSDEKKFIDGVDEPSNWIWTRLKFVFYGNWITAKPVVKYCKSARQATLALNHGITVLNSPGTIDSDYRGKIGVILFNTGDDPFAIRTGDRIALMVPAKCHRMFFVFDENTVGTRRGKGGFGSTGYRVWIKAADFKWFMV